MTASQHRVIVGMRTFASDVAHGFIGVTHNSLAVLGLGVACAAIALHTHPELRYQGEVQLMSWLKERQAHIAQKEAEDVLAVAYTPEPAASERATATNPKALPREQANVTYWLSKKYRVAAEPLAALVTEAYEIGARIKLDPTLILAVMAIESSFNPFAQSPVGAQGLMQVMTRVHTDKYQDFGGQLAAFDPVTNLRVGVKVLQECIARAGSLEGGLKYYVGAANLPSDGGYAAKVLAEHFRLRQVAGGRSPSATPPSPTLSTKASESVPTAPPPQEKVALLEAL